jgi:hypothetical protein
MLGARVGGAAGRSVRSPWLHAAVVIVVVVMAANLWKLAAGLDSDPVLHRAGLSAIDQPGILPGDHTIDPNDGYTLQALSRASLDQWLDGDAPYWNRYEGAGAPLAGEMQSMALHPFVLMVRLPHGFMLIQIVMESLAGVSTLFLLRRLGIGRAVALGAGIAYACNGTFAWLSNAAASPVAYLPLLLLGIEIARDASSRRRHGGWVLVAVAIAGSLYAGFPETAYINGLFACAWCAVRVGGLNRSAIRQYVLKLAAGGVAGLLLAAPVLVALLDYLPRANVGGHTGAFATATLPRTSVGALTMPYIYGPINAFNANTTSPNLAGFWSSIGGYLSVAQCTLALFTIGMRRLRWVQIAVAAWVVVYLSKTYRFGPVITVVNLLPGMKEMAFFRYSQPSVTLGILILAAYGAQRVVDERIGRRHIAVACATTATVLLAMALYARTETQHFVSAAHYNVYFAGSVLFALGAAAAGGALAWLPPFANRARVLGALLAVDAALMFVVPQLSTDRMTPVSMAPVEFLRQNLGLQRFYSLGPIAANYGSDFGIASLNVNDLPVPKAYSQFVLSSLDANTDPLLFTGTFRVNPAGPSALDEFIRNVDNYSAAGMKYLVTATDPAVADRVAQVGLQPVYDDGTVSIFEAPAVGSYFQTADPTCWATVVDWQSADVECDQPTTLIRLELADPGWSATVGGDDAAITTTGTIFQSVDVPAGTSHVVFRYAPRRIGFAWLGALLAVVWMAMSMVIVAVRGGRSRSADQAS